jgi:hypothetical protein
VIFYLFRLRRVCEVGFSKLMRWRELGSLMGLCATVGLATSWLPLEALPVAPRLALQLGFFAALLLLLFVLTGMLAPDEREMLRELRQRIFGRGAGGPR